MACLTGKGKIISKENSPEGKIFRAPDHLRRGHRKKKKKKKDFWAVEGGGTPVCAKKEKGEMSERKTDG